MRADRASSVHGINAYTSASGAAQDAARLLRTGAGYGVWRLSDGLFDFAAVVQPDSARFLGAVLVRHGHGQGGGRGWVGECVFCSVGVPVGDVLAPPVSTADRP